ncbi:MAG: hypothetical protein KC668_09910 [Myxococcales bacterium]|nr:hypothetical protein [Myxococcales bacterium]
MIRDGSLVAHSEEERFTRFKGSHFAFPTRSMTWMLKDNGLTFDDIDAVAWSWDQSLYRVEMPLFFLKNYLRHGLGRPGSGQGITKVTSHVLDNLPGHVRSRIRSELVASGVRGEVPPIHFLPHHLCHAASSFYMSGFEHSNVVVIDGSGEQHCTSLYAADANGIEELEHVSIPNSLGWYYAAVTEHLGFIPYRDEGKVMGLAAYGRPSLELTRKLAQVLTIRDDTYSVDPGYTLLGEHRFGRHFSDALVDLLGPPRPYEAPLEPRHQDIAFAAQHLLEQAAGAVVRRVQKLRPDGHLCLAGGVTLNCKMNGFLRRAPGVERLFVQPSANDAGSALGAALLFAQQRGALRSHTLRHTYYGSGYDDDQIEAKLKNSRLGYSRPADIHATVGQSLGEGKIVGVYQGRAEFGARALGNRSILANPLIKDARNQVNGRVKFREPWRPLCPSIMDEFRDRYMRDACDAPFMAVAFEVREEWTDLLSAVVHTDGTIRPQTVTKQQNEFLWRCIDAFRSITGHAIVMNTSFNVRGQPIVESPGDAIACFFATGLDALAIGPFWLEKRPGTPAA